MLGSSALQNRGLLPELEDFLPNLFVLAPFLYFIGADGIKRRRANFLNGFHLGMRRQASSRRVSFLPFLAGGPPVKQPGRVGMGSVFSQGIGGDRGDSFGEHISERGALFDSRWIVVRITGHAGGSLAGYQEFGELGMALVEFYIVGRDL